MTKVEVQKFRGDFQLAVAQLEKQYGVNVSLGTIRFDVNGLSAKMKAEKGEKIIRAEKDDFQVGDIVGINHKKVNKNDEFEVIKINAKNVKVRGVRGLMSVSPGLLVKK
tara:strand:- start:100 stop:426 length:327 start_codon:yes stop_codon:yes gene_type:complete